MIKSRLYGEEPPEAKRAVLTRAIDVYDAALRLLHPLMPFVTEELWQHLRSRPESASIMRAPYPEADAGLVDRQTELEMDFVQRAIEAVRNIRGEVGIAPSQDVALVVRISDARPSESIQRYAGYFQRLARVNELRFLTDGGRPRPAASAVVDNEELFIPLEGVIDIERERTRLRKEIERVAKMVEGVGNKLRNQSFLEKLRGMSSSGSSRSSKPSRRRLRSWNTTTRIFNNHGPRMDSPRLAAIMLPALLLAGLLRTAAIAETADSAAIAAIIDEGTHRSQVMESLSMITDVIGPRLTWSPGYDSAASWAARKLESWGVENVHREAWAPLGRGWTLAAVQCPCHRAGGLPPAVLSRSLVPRNERLAGASGRLSRCRQ